MEYYANFLNDLPQSKHARSVSVHVLNLVSGKIHQSLTKDVFSEHNFGNAEITEQDVREMYAANGIADEPSSVTISLESCYSGMEGRYKENLFRVIRSKSMTAVDKLNIALFIQMQFFRNPWHQALFDALELPKWKTLNVIKKSWSDPRNYVLTRKIGFADWTIHISEEPIFPLCDMPLLFHETPLRYYSVLSPYLLVEIDATVNAKNRVRTLKVAKNTVKHFMRMTAQNAKRHIIFVEPSLLDKWLGTIDIQDRIEYLKTYKPVRGIGKNILFHDIVGRDDDMVIYKRNTPVV